MPLTSPPTRPSVDPRDVRAASFGCSLKIAAGSSAARSLIVGLAKP
jgi:hypothetical protein